MIRFIPLLFIFLIAFLSGASEDRSRRDVSVSGRVTNSEDGSGIEGASLTFINDATGEIILGGIVTDVNGSYNATLGISVSAERTDDIPTEYRMAAPFPNPARAGDHVTVSWSSPYPASDEPVLTIVDLLGRRVSSGDRLAAGVYLLQLSFRRGRINISSRILVSEPGPVDFELRRTGAGSFASSGDRLAKRPSSDVFSGIGTSMGIAIVVEKSGFVSDAFQGRLQGLGSNTFNLQLSRASANLQTGIVNVIGSAEVGPAGNVLTVNAASTPIDGLIIDIPEGAYTDTRSVSVSYSEVVSHTFGSEFNVLSPAIQIDMGDGYAEQAFEVTVPVDLPPGHFAMAFMYDEATGEIEGMPATGLAEDAVKFSTRHLNRRRGLAASGKRGGFEVSFPVKILVASIPSSFLDNLGTIDSGFRPGIDDFDFPNYGSALSTGGQCSGQSISTMWYYLEKKIKLGEPALNGRYDRVANYWQDNPRAYRLASVLQEDHNWGGNLNKILLTVETTTELQILSWYAFGYSIFLTGLPQYVGLTSQVGGHAIVVYKVVPSENALYVSDPNYPGEERKIFFDGTSFIPYGTKQNATQVSTTDYTGVGYYAVSAMIDWDHVSRRWLELEDDSIGRSGVNAFPKTTHYFKTSDGFDELTDNISVSSDTIALKAECMSCELSYPGLSGQQSMIIINNSGEVLALTASRQDRLAVVHLAEGANELGIYTRTWYSYTDDQGQTRATTTWLDFRWVTLEKTPGNQGGNSAGATFRLTDNFAPFADLDVTLNVDFTTTLSGPGANLEFLEGDIIRARTDLSTANQLVISPAFVPADSTIIDFVDNSGDRTRYAVSPLRLGNKDEYEIFSQTVDFNIAVDPSTGTITIDYSTLSSGDLFRFRIPLYVVVHEQQWLSSGLQFVNSTEEWQTIYLHVDGLAN